MHENIAAYLVQGLDVVGLSEAGAEQFESVPYGKMHIFKSVEDVGACDETVRVVLFQNDLGHFLPGDSLDLIFSEFESGTVFRSDPGFLGFIAFLFKK